MISIKSFYRILENHGVKFFAGVPDSLLKDFCSFIEDNIPRQNHLITANEGSAIAAATGHYLATGNIPLIYMQNSGLGNAINPLVSLADQEVYSIPMLLLIGWRGEPDVKDEPQHVKMGKVTEKMLNILEIPYITIDSETKNVELKINSLFQSIASKKCPHAIVVKKNTFELYESTKSTENNYELTREKAIESVISVLDENDIVVSTTGKLSRELFELRTKKGEGNEKDFLTVGSMGHASQIALGISLSIPERRIFCLDGDGAALMHLGGWATIGEESPKNYIHVIFNNGAHESVGGQPTAGFFVDFKEIAKGCRYSQVLYADNETDVKKIVSKTRDLIGPIMIEIRVKNGARPDLGRPTKTPIENRVDFEQYIRREK